MSDPAWMVLLLARATAILGLGGVVVFLLRRSSSSARHAVRDGVADDEQDGQRQPAERAERLPGGAGPPAKAADRDPLRGDDRTRSRGGGTHHQAGRAGDAPPVSHRSSR